MLGVAVATTVIVALVLVVMPKPNSWLLTRFGRSKRFVTLSPSEGVEVQTLRDLIDDFVNVRVERWNVGKANNRLQVSFWVISKGGPVLDEKLSALAQSDLISDFQID